VKVKYKENNFIGVLGQMGLCRTFSIYQHSRAKLGEIGSGVPETPHVLITGKVHGLFKLE
jgi:hypothetical protein